MGKIETKEKMKDKFQVIPTADLLTEIESVEIVGGIGDITGNYALAKCPSNGKCHDTNTYCNGGNCVVGCGAPPEKEDVGENHP